MWFLLVYAASIALGAALGARRGSAALGAFWAMFLGPVGIGVMLATTRGLQLRRLDLEPDLSGGPSEDAVLGLHDERGRMLDYHSRHGGI